MKKKLCLIFSIAIANITIAQELKVESTFYVSSKSHVYVNDDINIDNAGTLMIDSDNTNSGVLIVTGNATGNLIYKRYIADTDWHFIAAPVIGQGINDFATNVENGIAKSTTTDNYGVSFYKNDNAKGTRWQYYTSTSGPLAAEDAGDFDNGKGYSNLRNSAGKYTFTGEMATTDVEVTIPAEAFTDHLWSVVGNPYPSFIDGEDLLTENSGELDSDYEALYVWNGSAYQTLNFANPGKIAPGQAFMVYPVADNTTFAFTEELQSVQEETSATFYRTAATPEITVKLASGNVIKTTSLKYFNNTTTGLDSGWDAGTYQDEDPIFAIDTHLVSDSNGIKFTLQCLPDYNYETSIVPLSVIAEANQTLTFSVAIANLPEDLNVYIEDKMKNTITDISTATYQVTPTQALNGIGRFYLYTASSVLSVENNVLSALSLYKTNNRALRVTGLQNQKNASIKMYSSTGKQVFTEQLSAESVQDIAIPTSLAIGVYIVNIASNKGTFTKKIIIE
jgi:hypothetical protein